ncbi:hypothetical protein Tco_0040767 [Tanacetum coccineum]
MVQSWVDTASAVSTSCLAVSSILSVSSLASMVNPNMISNHTPITNTITPYQPQVSELMITVTGMDNDTESTGDLHLLRDGPAECGDECMGLSKESPDDDSDVVASIANMRVGKGLTPLPSAVIQLTRPVRVGVLVRSTKRKLLPGSDKSSLIVDESGEVAGSKQELSNRKNHVMMMCNRIGNTLYGIPKPQTFKVGEETRVVLPTGGTDEITGVPWMGSKEEGVVWQDPIFLCIAYSFDHLLQWNRLLPVQVITQDISLLELSG